MFIYIWYPRPGHGHGCGHDITVMQCYGHPVTVMMHGYGHPVTVMHGYGHLVTVMNDYGHAVTVMQGYGNAVTDTLCIMDTRHNVYIYACVFMIQNVYIYGILDIQCLYHFTVSMINNICVSYTWYTLFISRIHDGRIYFWYP